MDDFTNNNIDVSTESTEPVRSRKPQQRRKKGPNYRLAFLIGGVLVVIVAIVCIILGVKSCGKKEVQAESETPQIEETVETQPTVAPETTKSAEELAREAAEKAVNDEIASYGNIGIINVSDGGYLNMRQQPDETAEIIGKIYNHSACSIQDVSAEDSSWYDSDSWKLISSGGFQGYVKADYLITGDEAKEKAKEYFAKRAIVTTDVLKVRAEPDPEATILTVVYKNERYEVLGTPEGWIRIDQGYISADYCEVRDCLNEARRFNEKEQVLNLYENLGITNVENYLNIRAQATTDSQIIGKLPGNSGADILSTEGDWCKIKSGPITGYVKAEYLTTGAQAREMAKEKASLMAICNEDVVNVRTEPSTDSGIWTQIIKKERYPVVKQLDNWVEIELGDTDDEGNPVTAYVSTDCVDVRYALNEAFYYSEEELQALNSDSRRSRIVKYALQFVGNRYVWGGTSLTNGCDCSGFTMRVFENYGISLPHYSGSQAKMGKAVSSSEMRPGDLIFYANSGGTINHVAIYMGNGQIVHAASRKSGIKTSAWNYRTPKAIRNLLGD